MCTTFHMLSSVVYLCLSITAEAMSGVEMPMKGCVEQGVAFFENLAHKVSVIGYTIFMHLVYLCLTVFLGKWETLATKSSSSMFRTVVLQCCMFVTQLLG